MKYYKRTLQQMMTAHCMENYGKTIMYAGEINPHTHNWGDIVDRPSVFPPMIHNHDSSYYTIYQMDIKLADKSNINHIHSWSDITNRPSTFTPSSHEHPWSQVTNKPTTYSPSPHGHIWGDLTDVPVEFTPSQHNHDWTEINGTPNEFPPESHSHTWSQITGKPVTFNPSEHVHPNLLDVSIEQIGGVVLSGPTNGKAVPEFRRLVASDLPGHTHTRLDITDFPTSMPASDVYAWAKKSTKPSYTPDEVGADPAGSSYTALQNAKSYTDARISNLLNGASETMDTLKEIEDAFNQNKDIVSALNTAIGTKVANSEFLSHTGNNILHITSQERTNWNVAKSHADQSHAPSNAERNVITTIKRNGSVITPDTNRSVNIEIPEDYILNGSQTTTSSEDGGSNVFTFTRSGGGTATFTVKNGSQGSKGSTGTRGSNWFAGTGITGTDASGRTFASSGVSSALVNDMYLNTVTGNIYRCISSGTPASALWQYKGCIKGASGDTIEVATKTEDGLLSAADKAKLDGIATGANKYTLPTASASVLGGIKVGTHLSISSGTLTIANHYVAQSELPNNFSNNYPILLSRTSSSSSTTGAAYKAYAYLYFNISTKTLTCQNFAGNATSASKLATPRKINGVAFDGTADVSISDRRYVIVGSDASGSGGWYKFAEGTINQNCDEDILFSIMNTYNTGYVGLFHVALREYNGAIATPSFGWVARLGFDLHDICMVTSGYKVTLYIKIPQSQWGRCMIEVLSASTRIDTQNALTLISSTSPTASVIPTHYPLDLNRTYLPDSINFGRRTGSTIGANTVVIGEDQEASQDRSILIGQTNVCGIRDSIIVGFNNTITSSTGSHRATAIFGKGHIVEDSSGSVIEGYTHTVKAKNVLHVEGNANIVEGPVQGSHIEGYGVTVKNTSTWNVTGIHTEGRNNQFTIDQNDYNMTGSYSHIEGNANIVNNSFVCHMEGQENTILGTQSSQQCHVEGYGNTSVGNQNHVEGHSNDVYGIRIHCGGYRNLVRSDYATAIGKWCKETSGPQFNFNAGDTSQLGDVFVIGNGTNTARSNALRVTMDGEILGTKSFQSAGADYAEFIRPWFDENKNGEDRIGYFVTIRNGKLYKANPGDYIAGITSGNPSVVGNADEDYYWKYERDEFNRIVYEDIPEMIVKKENGKIVYDADNEPVLIESGRMIKNARMKLSKDYDPSKQNEYIGRKYRDEWDYVGMVGVLPVRDDGTCVAEGWCRCGKDGVATLAEERSFDTYFVLERISENIVSVILK